MRGNFDKRLKWLFDKFSVSGEKGKMTWLLGGIAALGVMLMILGGLAGSEKPESPPVSPPSQVSASGGEENAIAREEKILASHLEEMLGQVEGAGRVKVVVRLSGSTSTEYAVNTTTGLKTTEEKDQSGGTRLITENNSNDQIVLIKRSSGVEDPLVHREVAPKISGILVLSQGAADPVVKARLFEAVQVGLGVEPQKIMILPMGGSDG